MIWYDENKTAIKVSLDYYKSVLNALPSYPSPQCVMLLNWPLCTICLLELLGATKAIIFDTALADDRSDCKISEYKTLPLVFINTAIYINTTCFPMKKMM